MIAGRMPASARSAAKDFLLRRPEAKQERQLLILNRRRFEQPQPILRGADMPRARIQLWRLFSPLFFRRSARFITAT